MSAEYSAGATSAARPTQRSPSSVCTLSDPVEFHGSRCSPWTNGFSVGHVSDQRNAIRWGISMAGRICAAKSRHHYWSAVCCSAGTAAVRGTAGSCGRYGVVRCPVLSKSTANGCVTSHFVGLCVHLYQARRGVDQTLLGRVFSEAGKVAKKPGSPYAFCCHKPKRAIKAHAYLRSAVQQKFVPF